MRAVTVRGADSLTSPPFWDEPRTRRRAMTSPDVTGSSEVPRDNYVYGGHQTIDRVPDRHQRVMFHHPIL